MSTPEHTPVELEIRRLQSDAEVQQCAQLMAHSEPWITLHRTFAESLRILQHPAKEVYVAIVQGQFAGFIILDLNGAFHGYLQTIAVMPEWRNAGIGSQLIKFAEARIFREAPNVFICVSSFNLQAQRFYARLGYERVGELKNYVVAGHAEFLLRKTIAPLTEFVPTV
jgi:[ribosomal protein S18]-alanine N-acetyltransferase